jgi:hypothetical protein
MEGQDLAAWLASEMKALACCHQPLALPLCVSPCYPPTFYLSWGEAYSTLNRGQFIAAAADTVLNEGSGRNSSSTTWTVH